MSTMSSTVAGTTVRIREETREALRELERMTGLGTQDLLARAVEQYRRDVILAETNAAYARTADSPEFRDELADWEATLLDGLEDE
jgi:hypothetical protein